MIYERPRRFRYSRADLKLGGNVSPAKLGQGRSCSWGSRQTKAGALTWRNCFSKQKLQRRYIASENTEIRKSGKLKLFQRIERVRKPSNQKEKAVRMRKAGRKEKVEVGTPFRFPCWKTPKASSRNGAVNAISGRVGTYLAAAPHFSIVLGEADPPFLLS